MNSTLQMKRGSEKVSFFPKVTQQESQDIHPAQSDIRSGIVITPQSR